MRTTRRAKVVQKQRIRVLIYLPTTVTFWVQIAVCRKVSVAVHVIVLAPRVRTSDGEWRNTTASMSTYLAFFRSLLVVKLVVHDPGSTLTLTSAGQVITGI